MAEKVRIGWQAYDLKTTSGAIVEVKSAAYLQSWAQAKLSSINFTIAPTLAWDGMTGKFDQTSRRQSDVYVFALLQHKDKTTLDPLNVEQWMFFVLGTKSLNETVANQKTISMARLYSLNPAKVTFAALRDTIERIATTEH